MNDRDWYMIQNIDLEEVARQKSINDYLRRQAKKYEEIRAREARRAEEELRFIIKNHKNPMCDFKYSDESIRNHFDLHKKGWNEYAYYMMKIAIDIMSREEGFEYKAELKEVGFELESDEWIDGDYICRTMTRITMKSNRIEVVYDILERNIFEVVSQIPVIPREIRMFGVKYVLRGN